MTPLAPGIATTRDSALLIPKKPKALSHGSRIGVIAPASPARPEKIAAGLAELERLGFLPEPYSAAAPDGFFAGNLQHRKHELAERLNDSRLDGLIGLRGGYGANYLLDSAEEWSAAEPKILVGYSDLTSLQIFLWQKFGWVTFYGPMVAAGFEAGAGNPCGYDENSFRLATTESTKGWSIALHGEALLDGEAEGRLLGGCMTLLEATIGTPWELNTKDAILVLEDRAMKPYQVDRVLMHFLQAGKLKNVRGLVFGDFPESEPSVAGSPTVRDVCARILRPLSVPVVFGSPIGHTPRPMLTLPLGVRARLIAKGEGELEILEPAVVK